MTRLEAFAARLTREMLEHWHGAQPTEAGVAKVAERLIREFTQDAMWQAQGPTRKHWRDAFAWLDEPGDGPGTP